MTALPDEARIWDALREVDDPEAGMNIVDLGLVYTVAVAEHGIDIEMTMTTPACPVADLLVEQSRQAVEAVVPAGLPVRVQLVWEPFWTPSMMTGVARDHFGWPA